MSKVGEEISLPKVSVLMTTFRNTYTDLSRSVDSILNQTFDDFEFIIIFEPEDENYEKIRQNYSDPRLVLSVNTKNIGRSASYNRGLLMARGQYLARMDADDFCQPHRLMSQVAYFREHPDISVLSTAMRLVDSTGKEVGFRAVPTSHKAIVHSFALTNPMCHPTIMWDREKVGKDLQFDPRFSAYCDDLELWLRLLVEGHRFANLPEAFIDYLQPAGYRRPRGNWAKNFQARRLHWRLGLRYPRFFIGIGLFAVLLMMPMSVIDWVIQRNPVSDRLRSIRSA